jgi:ABC-type transporter Mla subunit MlaD
MEKTHLEWKVGLFVFIGLALLATLLIEFGKGAPLFRSTYNLYVNARNVGGLKTRATVLMAGVQIGTVSDIRLGAGGTNVVITLRLYKDYGVASDARFVIEQSGFLGDQFIAIVQTGSGAPLFKPGSEAFVEEPFNLQEVARSATGFIKRIDETARKLNDTVSDVRRLVLNEQTLSNLSATVSTLRTASEHALTAVDKVNGVIDTNRPSVGMAVSNVVAFSEQMGQVGTHFSGMMATNSAEITAAVQNIESATATLKAVLDDLEAGKGLAGNVLRNEALASDFRAITGNLSITTSNLNRLGLWGILWSHKPPPATNEPPVQRLESPKYKTD